MKLKLLHLACLVPALLAKEATDQAETGDSEEEPADSEDSSEDASHLAAEEERCRMEAEAATQYIFYPNWAHDADSMEEMVHRLLQRGNFRITEDYLALTGLLNGIQWKDLMNNATRQEIIHDF